MKKVLFFLMVFGLVLTQASFAKDLKLGYVDVFKVFDEYQKTKDYDKVLEGKKQEEEKKLEAKKKEIEAMQGKLGLLKEKEQNQEKEKITKAVQAYRTMEQESFTTLKNERDTKMKEIVDDIDKVVRDYAEKNGYDLVVNENILLYGSKAMDLTAEILRLVNEGKSSNKPAKK